MFTGKRISYRLKEQRVKKRMSLEEVREVLSEACAPTQMAWAERHGVSRAYVSDVLLGKRAPGKAILKALGLKRVEIYERVG